MVNVLKRLESSVHSFRKTLEAISAKNTSVLAMLEAGTSGTVGTSGTEIEDLDDEEEIASLCVGKHAIDIADLNVESYKRDLKADIAAFRDILQKIKPIDVDHDAKLKRLKELIAQKATVKLDASDFQEVLSRFSPVSKERPEFASCRGAETQRLEADGHAGRVTLPDIADGGHGVTALPDAVDGRVRAPRELLTRWGGRAARPFAAAPLGWAVA